MTFASSRLIFSWIFLCFGYAPYMRKSFLCPVKGQFYHVGFGFFVNIPHRHDFTLADGSSSLCVKVGDKLMGNGSGKIWHVDHITKLGVGIDFTKGGFNWCAMRKL